MQETLGWDEARGVTYSQRSKEEAHDYRYFPEPDLPPLVVEQEWIERIAASLPELPYARAKRFAAAVRAEPLPMPRCWPATRPSPITLKRPLRPPAGRDGCPPRMVANWITGEIFGWLNQTGQDLSGCARSTGRSGRAAAPGEAARST